jgi:hypothetical protein
MLLCCLLMVALCLVAYHRVLLFDSFSFDDHFAVENNHDAWSNTTESIWSVFTHDFWGKGLLDVASHRSYRPLTVLTYRLEHFLHGGAFNVQHMFWTNVGLHCICSLLVFAFLCRALGDEVGLFAAALFSVHPVHSEAVAGLVGRSELLSALFGLMGMISMQRPWSIWSRCCACVWFAVAFLCKDSAIALSGMFFIVCTWEWLRGGASNVWRDVLLCGGLLFAALGARYALTGGLIDLKGSGLLRHVENPQHFVPAGRLRYLFLWLIQVKYAELLFWPTRLCAEYSFNCIPMIESAADPRILPMALGTTAFVIMAVKCLLSLVSLCRAMNGAKQHNSVNSAVCAQTTFAALLVVVPYAPLSHLFVTIGTFIAERCLYTPSIGACALMAILLLFALPTLRVRPEHFLVFTLSLMLIVTTGRVPDWSSDRALFESAVAVCPNSAKNHQQLALALFNDRELLSGVAHLWRANEIDPTYGEPLYHLARYYATTDPGKSLALSRQCSLIAVSAPLCLVQYLELRSAFRPLMTDVEKLADTADIMLDARLKAHQLRQLGLKFIDRQEHCAAVKPLVTSMRERSQLGEYGIIALAESGVPPKVEDTFCNAAYWAVVSMERCPGSFSVDDMCDLAANATRGGCRFNASRYESIAAQHGHKSVHAIALGAELCQTVNQITTNVLNRTLTKALADPSSTTVFSLHRCNSVAELLLNVADTLADVLSVVPERHLRNLAMHRQTIGTYHHVAVQVLGTCIRRAVVASKTEAAIKILRLAKHRAVRDQLFARLRDS